MQFFEMNRMVRHITASLFLIFAIIHLSHTARADKNAEAWSDKIAIFEDKSAITEIQFGKKKSNEKIEIYISPSCLHCGKFVAEDLESFIQKHDDEVVLKFLPTSAKDIFIMKIIQNEAQDKKSYFEIYKKYIKRAIATINFVNPTKEQIDKFKGSKKDPEMIKFQVVASEFGFSDKKIMEAFPDPNMTEPFERSIMLAYSKNLKVIYKLVDTKELDLPLIAKSGKLFKNLDDALRN